MKKLMRVTVLMVFFCALCLSGVAQAKFPDKRVTFICVYEVGGGTDAVFRVVAKHAEKELGVPVVVKNITGGAGQVGWTEFKRVKPDGYTLSHENMPQFVILPLAREAGFHFSEFEPLNSFGIDNVLLYVRNESPWKTFDDFLKYAKEHPGVVTVGIGHYLEHMDLTAILLEEKADVKLQRVALGGGGPMKVALLGGHVSINCGNISGAYRLLDKIRPLAVAAEERHPLFPEVPTLKEKGYDIIQGVERGFIALKGTPPERVTFWRQFFVDLFKKEALIEDLKKAGLPVNFKDHDWVLKNWQEREKEYRTILMKRGMISK